jgi:hypothetical protein
VNSSLGRIREMNILGGSIEYMSEALKPTGLYPRCNMFQVQVVLHVSRYGSGWISYFLI